MKTKSFKNKNFVIVAILTVFTLAIFNFLMDPYNIFRNKIYSNIYDLPRKYISIVLKSQKNVRNDTIIIGSSDVDTLFASKDIYSFFFNKLALHSTSCREQYFLLEDYLSLHPELKKAFLIVGYPTFLHYKGEKIPRIKGKNLTIKELSFLLFSEDATRLSLSCLKNGKPIISNKKGYEKFFTDKPELYQFFQYSPNTAFNVNINKTFHQQIKEENEEYLKKMINLLKEKNIDYYIIIPPTHAIYLSMLSTIPYLQKSVDDIKRLYVELSSNDVYDFSVMNKYTTSDIVNKNYLYCDLLHPNLIMGMKVFKVIHDGISEKDFCEKLNKNNIEKQIVVQNRLVAEYYKNNKDIVDKFLHFHETNPNADIAIREERSFKGAPEYITQEIEIYKLLIEKRKEMINSGDILPRGIFKNKLWINDDFLISDNECKRL